MSSIMGNKHLKHLPNKLTQLPGYQRYKRIPLRGDKTKEIDEPGGIGIYLNNINIIPILSIDFLCIVSYPLK